MKVWEWWKCSYCGYQIGYNPCQYCGKKNFVLSGPGLDDDLSLVIKNEKEAFNVADGLNKAFLAGKESKAPEIKKALNIG